jgi:hypothetical protein
MLGGPGAGTNAGFWSRFVMAEGVGVWAMELIHGLTGFGDLYPFGGDMGGFDEMACSCGTHPSAYTKAAIGWLDRGAIAAQNGRSARHELHSVGLTQPPPSGRSAAVRIGTSVPYLMSKRASESTSSTPGSPARVRSSTGCRRPIRWAMPRTARHRSTY